MAPATPVEGLGADTSARRAARLLLRARLGDLQREVARLLEPPPRARAAQEGGLEVEGVHDLRVAARRLNVAMAFFRALPKKGLRRLSALKKSAGEVRDLQLHLQRMRTQHKGKAERSLADVLGPETAQALAQAIPRLREELARFAEELEPALAAGAEEASPPGKLGGRRLRKRLARRLDEVALLLSQARLLEPEPAHALRKGCKRLRDEAELLLPAFPQALSALVKLISPLQEALGQLHDADVHLQLLAAAGLAFAAAQAQRERAALAKPLLVQLGAWTRSGRLATLASALRERR
jgi:CHAD domain-containing protein